MIIFREALEIYLNGDSLATGIKMELFFAPNWFPLDLKLILVAELVSFRDEIVDQLSDRHPSQISRCLLYYLSDSYYIMAKSNELLHNVVLPFNILRLAVENTLFL